jgi:hypothetical protein
MFSRNPVQQKSGLAEIWFSRNKKSPADVTAGRFRWEKTEKASNLTPARMRLVKSKYRTDCG